MVKDTRYANNECASHSGQKLAAVKAEVLMKLIDQIDKFDGKYSILKLAWFLIGFLMEHNYQKDVEFNSLQFWSISSVRILTRIGDIRQKLTKT